MRKRGRGRPGTRGPHLKLVRHCMLKAMRSLFTLCLLYIESWELLPESRQSFESQASTTPAQIQ